MWLEKIEVLNELGIVSVCVKILLALVLGGLLGLEREQKHRPAGLRTYVLVCIGATLACITNIYMCSIYKGNDPARIPAQVISGMGFLGAGTIIVTRRQRIKGLTTAAGLWCCAAIGIALGSGFYSGAIISTAIIVIALRVLEYVDFMVERNNNSVSYFIEFDDNSFVREFIKYAKSNSYRISDLEILSNKSGDINSATVTLKLSNSTDKEKTIAEIEGLNGCLLVERLY